MLFSIRYGHAKRLHRYDCTKIGCAAVWVSVLRATLVRVTLSRNMLYENTVYQNTETVAKHVKEIIRWQFLSCGVADDSDIAWKAKSALRASVPSSRRARFARIAAANGPKAPVKRSSIKRSSIKRLSIKRSSGQRTGIWAMGMLYLKIRLIRF